MHSVGMEYMGVRSGSRDRGIKRSASEMHGAWGYTHGKNNGDDDDEDEEEKEEDGERQGAGARRAQQPQGSGQRHSSHSSTSSTTASSGSQALFLSTMPLTSFEPDLSSLLDSGSEAADEAFDPATMGGGVSLRLPCSVRVSYHEPVPEEDEEDDDQIGQSAAGDSAEGAQQANENSHNSKGQSQIKSERGSKQSSTVSHSGPGLRRKSSFDDMPGFSPLILHPAFAGVCSLQQVLRDLESTEPGTFVVMEEEAPKLSAENHLEQKPRLLCCLRQKDQVLQLVLEAAGDGRIKVLDDSGLEYSTIDEMAATVLAPLAARPMAALGAALQ